jgi:hypothetical protein
MERFDEAYEEFAACLQQTYMNETDGGGIEDVRDKWAKRYLREQALIWLEPHNFAAAFSNGLALSASPAVAAQVVDLAALDGEPLAQRLTELARQGALPLVTRPRHPAERAIKVLIEEGLDSATPSLRLAAAELLRTTAVIYRKAQSDDEIRMFLWRPGK